MPTLTVLMGTPGSGKTTWTTRNHNGRVLCSTDPIRTSHLDTRAIVAFTESLRTRARRALATGHDVITDGCNVRRNERTRWLQLAHQHGAAAELVVLHADLATVLDVQRQRDQPVPVDKMRAYHRQWQASLAVIGGEGWARITHVHRDVLELERRWTTVDQP